MSQPDNPSILVLGAGGLIGEAITHDLLRRGFAVTAVARRFTPAQQYAFGAGVREMPVADLDAGQLATLLRSSAATIVVNCLGVLQDNAVDSTQDIHHAFVARLIAALRAVARPVLLVHISVPGAADSDRTAFSRSKREAEHLITSSGLPYAILRPGFVFARRAFGGSALMRALAALPLDLPRSFGERPLAVVAVEDIADTVVYLAKQTQRAVVWDLVHPDVPSLAQLQDRLRLWLGGVARPRITLPLPLLKLGAWLGDAVAWLGWRPPIRSTPLAELQRGVTGDPRPWMAATGIAPRALDDVLRAHPAAVQEKWFARLFLVKGLIIPALVVFWSVSGLIALTVFADAVGILTAHGISAPMAEAMTVVSCAVDISVGLAIAFRRTCSRGLIAGIIVSLGYMSGAAVLTPELWLEPLGALVKTGPAIVLMLVALAILDDR